MKVWPKRPKELKLPRVSLERLKRLLEAEQKPYRNFVASAAKTGWATDGRLLVKLPDHALQEWKKLVGPQDDKAKGPPVDHVLGLAAGRKYGPPFDFWKLGWDEQYGVVAELDDGEGHTANVRGEHLAFVRLFYPGVEWFIAREKDRPVVAKTYGATVALVAPIFGH